MYTYCSIHNDDGAQYTDNNAQYTDNSAQYTNCSAEYTEGQQYTDTTCIQHCMGAVTIMLDVH